MPPTSPAAPSEATYRAGTLVYNAAGLRKVFAWLLAGEVVFVLIDMIEPRVLPVLLQMHGASDKEIAIIIGSVNAALQLLIMPPLGYYSDRLRTRWGRRIPILFWATPFVSLFLALTPFAPDIAEWAMSVPGLAAAMRALPMNPVVTTFALLVLIYRFVQNMTNAAFFGLLRDVVPDTHMGRFLALFRIFGAGGTFVITYWLLGHVEDHSHEIFIGIAVLNFFGFGALCWFVREGQYPDVPGAAEEVEPSTGKGWRAVKVFVRESYRHPVYLWVYFIRTCLYGALLGLSGFVVFFPQHELGMDLGQVGRVLSWPALVWLVIAYPIGQWIDARGAMKVLNVGLIVITLGYLLSYFFVVGPMTFFASAMVTGVAFWVVMLAQLKLAQEVFHPQRYSQLAGANTIVQSLAIAVIVSPGAGWVLDLLKGTSFTLAMPLVGDVSFGPYRLVNLMMGVLYAGAWFGLSRVQRYVDAHGGRANYQAPL